MLMAIQEINNAKYALINVYFVWEKIQMIV